MPQSSPMQLIMVSGRSGSGKSSALHALEDLGFYCVDNLPTRLIPSLIHEFKDTSPPNADSDVMKRVDKLAIGIDARNLRFSENDFHKLVTDLHNIDDLNTQVIYLDADNDPLLRRFSEPRRKHPIASEQTSLHEALELEKKILSPLITDSTMIIDTSTLSLHQLRDEMGRIASSHPKTMTLLIQSFGFKYGIPKDSDLIFDVRCLINPHWVPQLRPLTGLDPEIIEFLSEDQKVQDMKKTIINYLENWLPDYQINNRPYLTVSVGCTGGQHRSVFLAEEIRRALSSSWSTQIRHRQLMKPSS